MSDAVKGFHMPRSKALIGAIIGAALAILMIVFDAGALIFVGSLAAAGWLIGTVLDRPDAIISLLQRLQER